MKSLNEEIQSIVPHLEALKEIARKKRESGEQKLRKPLLDFRHLNSCNLEENDHVYTSSARFECKPLPYCGRCAEGYQYTIDASGNRTAELCSNR